MFVRVDDIILNLEELQSAQIIPDRDTSRPVLKMNFKRGRTVYAPGEHGLSTLLYDVIIEALEQSGQLYEPNQEPEPEIELSEELTELLRQLHDAGYNWIARDFDAKCFAYRNKPILEGAYWRDVQCVECEVVKKELLEDLDCDDEPLNILELLLGT